MFLLARPCRSRRSYELKYPIQTKKESRHKVCFLFLAEKERFCLAVLGTALHCWRYRIILRKRGFACILRRLPLLSAPLIAHRARSRTSLSRLRRARQISLRQRKNKTTRLGGFIFWRRRRDLNLCAAVLFVLFVCELK